MKEFVLESFSNLEDAVLWLEQTLYDLEIHHDDLKGELTKINNEWRVAVITGTAQYELDV